MKKTTIRNGFMASAALLGAMSGTAVFAETAVTPAAGPAISLGKKLIFNDAAVNAPSATFNFALASATPTAEEIAKGVVAGINPELATVTGTEAGKLAFAPADVYTDDADATRHVTKEIKVDMSAISFTKAGIYKYKITESGTIPGITNDAAADKYIFVYVTDTGAGLGTTTLSATAVLSTGDVDTKVGTTTLITTEDGGGVTAGTEVSLAYTNTADKVDSIALSHQTSGNEADRTKLFTYTVSFTNLGVGSEYPITYGNGAASNTGNVASFTATAADQTLTLYMKDDDTATISGLPEGTTWQVTVSDPNNSGYTLSAASTAAAVNLTADDKYDGTATRSGTVPTGILLEVAPYALGVVAAGAGMIILGKRKKDEE